MTAEDKTLEQTNQIIFNYEGNYYFTVKKTLAGKEKKVYIGTFDSKNNTQAPTNCSLDTIYCLKSADIQFPLNNFKHPQQRHYWDFVFFRGNNIREILASNYGTRKLNDDIKNGKIDVCNNNNNKKSDKYHCIVIEPYYDQFNPDDFRTPIEKIDCIKQIIAGLKQLMNSQIVDNTKITAHRDLKFLNVMVERKENGKRVIRLIDFPSVKISISDNTVNNADDTMEGAFSYSNTTPDNVIADYQVSSKNDVFVLGCMLLEIFRVCKYENTENPLFALFKKTGLDEKVSYVENCAGFYKKMTEKYPYGGSTDKSWLEKALEENSIFINWDNINGCSKQVKELFRASTAIDPEHRISLDDFEHKINKIIEALDSESRELKKMLFLIDTSDLVSNYNQYLFGIKKIMASKWSEIEPVIIGYDWVDSDMVLTLVNSSLVCINSKPAQSISDIETDLKSLSASIKCSTSKSTLNGCLYKAVELINTPSYCSDIHIFTTVPPVEDHMCVLQCPKKGSNEARQLCCSDIAGICQDLKIYVYSYNGETERWYTPEFFTKSQDISMDENGQAEPVNYFDGGKQQNKDSPASSDTDDFMSKLIITGD